MDLLLVNNNRMVIHTDVFLNSVLSDHSTMVSYLSSPIVDRKEIEVKMKIYKHDLDVIDFNQADEEDWIRYSHMLNKNVWSERPDGGSGELMEHLNSLVVMALLLTMLSKSATSVAFRHFCLMLLYYSAPKHYS